MDYFIGHLIGDFMLQNRWLARVKKNPWGVALHAVIASTPAILLSGWGIIQGFAAMASHLLIDGLAIGKRWPDFAKQGNPNNDDPPPDWLRLIMDQCMHLVCLYSINRWL